MINIASYEIPQGYKLVPVASTDSQILHALERAWTRLRTEQGAGIPDLVFSLQPSRSSSCGQIDFATSPVMTLNLAPGWDGKDDGTLAEHKLSGGQIMAYLAHHAAHAVAGPTTAQEGRFHSAAYRDAAQELGLTVEHTASGYSKTAMAKGTLTRYKPEISALDAAMAQWAPVKARKRRSNTVSLRCSCNPPRYLSASAGTAAAGQIRCEICGQEFVTSS